MMLFSSINLHRAWSRYSKERSNLDLCDTEKEVAEPAAVPSRHAIDLDAVISSIQDPSDTYMYMQAM